MGTICSKENYPESRKMFNSFIEINQENEFNFTINNYDKNCGIIKSLSKNNFEKLGQMQQLRVDFIKEIREDLTTSNNYNYNNINYFRYGYVYNNYNYNYNQLINNLNNYNDNETDKILYYIIIITLTLKSYLRREYI